MANERILIVEDEGSVTTLLEHFLKRAGFVLAGKVETGGDALRQAKKLQPDLVLMDIGLKGDIDGVDTARLLNDRYGTPVVFLSGLTDDVTLKRVEQSDSFGYVIKPFREEELKASIELALNKHRGQRKLKQFEHWFAAAIQAIGEGVITTDAAAQVTSINPVAESLTGWTKAQVVGRRLSEVFHLRAESSPGVPGNPASLLAENTLIPGSPRQAILVAREGREIPIEMNVSPIRNDQRKAIGSVLIFRDISERKQAEAELHRSREEFRSLATHLQSVREEERTRIAREVHDELGQLVTGLKLELAWLEKQLPESKKGAGGPNLLEKTRVMSELLNEIVQSVRKISAELRPGVLDNLGLTAALQWQAREFQTRTGIPCVIETGLAEAVFDPELSTAVFRIFQESLTNVTRHARATRVTVSFKKQADELWLEVRDNGRGVSDPDLVKNKSFGLLGMRERVVIFGGEFRIQGDAGQGTLVTAKFPLPKPSTNPIHD